MHAIQHSKGHVCIKLKSKSGNEISIAFDDSCKAEMPTIMRRVGMAIFSKDDTQLRIGDEIFDPTTDDLIAALRS